MDTLKELEAGCSERFWRNMLGTYCDSLPGVVEQATQEVYKTQYELLHAIQDKQTQ